MIARKERHPSTFDLDVFFARGNPEDEGVEAHLEACDRCRRYVEELELWTFEKAASQAPSKGRPQRLATWTISAVIAVALVAAAVIAFRSLWN
jgi:hypothetical protein